MKLHDVECPICGTVNHKLCLEETNGWMECEHCNNSVQSLKFAKFNRVPLYTSKQLVDKFAPAG